MIKQGTQTYFTPNVENRDAREAKTNWVQLKHLKCSADRNFIRFISLDHTRSPFSLFVSLIH